MGKPKQSTTENTFPPWLMQALQPLMRASTENMLNFQSQGQQVLQGKDYRNAPTAQQLRQAQNARMYYGPENDGLPNKRKSSNG